MIQLKMHSVMYVPSPGGDMEGSFIYLFFKCACELQKLTRITKNTDISHWS